MRRQLFRLQSGWHKEKQRFPRDGQLEGIRGKENESNPSLGKKKRKNKNKEPEAVGHTAYVLLHTATTITESGNILSRKGPTGITRSNPRLHKGAPKQRSFRFPRLAVLGLTHLRVQLALLPVQIPLATKQNTQIPF